MWQVSAASQCLDHGAGEHITRPLPGSECGIVDHRPNVRILLERLDEKVGEQPMVARGHRDAHLPRRAGVQLRGAPSTGENSVCYSAR
jgi:hypothetical protein